MGLAGLICCCCGRRKSSSTSEDDGPAIVVVDEESRGEQDPPHERYRDDPENRGDDGVDREQDTRAFKDLERGDRSSEQYQDAPSSSTAPGPSRIVHSEPEAPRRLSSRFSDSLRLAKGAFLPGFSLFKRDIGDEDPFRTTYTVTRPGGAPRDVCSLSTPFQIIASRYTIMSTDIIIVSPTPFAATWS